MSTTTTSGLSDLMGVCGEVLEGDAVHRCDQMDIVEEPLDDRYGPRWRPGHAGVTHCSEWQEARRHEQRPSQKSGAAQVETTS